MAKQILIRPVISEKSELLSDKIGQYSFIVAKDANKVEIRKAIEETYNVSVDSVNTIIVPGKSKMRSTRSGIVRGRKSAYKKAIITVAEGEEINYYGEL